MTYRSDAFYMGSFMGRHCLNGDNERIESLEFPVEAFKDFLRAEGLPMPDFWQTKTGSTDGHIKPDPAVCPVTAAPSLPNECREAVSYTHLDVYKRQMVDAADSKSAGEQP